MSEARWVRGVVRSYDGIAPTIARGVFVADTATVVGDVVLAEGASVWYGAVLRGDVAPIRIGRRSNVQDVSMVHATTDLSTAVIGEDVTVGHRVVLHGCTIGDRVLVGMGSIVLDLAVIESDVVLGAGSLVPPRMRLESGYLYLGSPAKKIRALRAEDHAMIAQGWQSYIELGAKHAV